MLGLGSLAFGSGAVLSSAAFADTVQTSADMRVRVAEDLEVRAGQAFEDDGTVRSGFGEKYVEFSDNDSFFGQNEGLEDITTDDLPVATVNRRDENVNADVNIQLAVPINGDDVITFEDILEVENRGTGAVEIGISYDREDGQYGADVKEDGEQGTDVTPELVQHVYQFIVPKEDSRRDRPTRISPDDSELDDDRPNLEDEIQPGETISLDLEVHLRDWEPFVTYDTRQIIRDAVETGNVFEEPTLATVDMLDEIRVGTDPDTVQ